MAAHRLEATLPCSTAMTQQEQNVSNKDVDQASVPTIPPGRRSEARKAYPCLCSYEVLDATEEESVVIEQGTAVALNQTTEGILLFMRQAPHVRQVIETHIPRQERGWAVSLFAVRWTRAVQVESFGGLYLVGCRRLFDRCH